MQRLYLGAKVVSGVVWYLSNELFAFPPAAPLPHALGMVLSPTSPRQRILPFVNKSGETIPPFGAIKLKLARAGETAEHHGYKPDKDDDPFVVFNGPTEVAADQASSCTADHPLWAMYNPVDGTPANGESLGTRAGYWQLYRGYEGFLVWGGADGEKVYVQSDVTCREVGSGNGGLYSGYSTNSGPRLPNGCAGCPCCPCVCWWATRWHKTLTKESGLVGPIAPLNPDPLPPGQWLLTSNDLVVNDTLPEWGYLGDYASEEGHCAITGIIFIDDDGNPVAPGHPFYEPLAITGTLTYTHSITGRSVVVTAELKLDFTVQWSCEGLTVVVTDAGASTGSTNPDYTFNGAEIGFIGFGSSPEDIIERNGSVAISTDYALSGPNGDEDATLFDNCHIISGPLNNYPALEIIPLYDPECVDESDFDSDFIDSNYIA